MSIFRYHRVIGLSLIVIGACGLSSSAFAASPPQETEIEIIPDTPQKDDCWAPCAIMPALQAAGDEAKATSEKTKESIVQVQAEAKSSVEEATSRLEDLLSRFNIRYGFGFGFNLSRSHSAAGAHIRYNRRLTPSYRNSFTTLTDDYILDLAANYNTLADIGNDVKSGKNFGVEVRQQYRFTFAQQYQGHTWQDHLKIAIEDYYTPLTHTPYSAERALKRMKIGDFFSFQAPLNLIVSASQFRMLTHSVPASVSAFYGISGEFDVHLYRLSETKYRLKLFAIREQKFGARFAIGYLPGDDQYFSVRIIDAQARRLLKVAPLEIALTFPESNLAMVDYIINLSDDRVVKAFDEMARSAFKPRQLRIMNRLQDKDEFKSALLVDISPFNDIYNQDKDIKSPEGRAVERMFQGTNDTKNAFSPSFGIGIPGLARFAKSDTYAENQLIAIDRNNKTRYFYMPTYILNQSTDLLFGLFNTEATGSANLLIETDENGEPKSFGELSFQLDYRDRMFRASEIRELQDRIKKRLPEEIFAQIPWGQWAENKDRSNARVTWLLVFRSTALEVIERQLVRIQNVEGLHNRFLAHLYALPQIETLPDTSCIPFERPTVRRLKGPDGKWRENLDDKYFCEIQAIYSNLFLSLDSRRPAQERVAAFLGLKTNPLWQEVGPGFLVELLGNEKLREMVSFETTWEAKHVDTLHFTYGTCRNRRLYQSVNYIYRMLYDRGIDLRLVDNPNDIDAPEFGGDENSCN